MINKEQLKEIMMDLLEVVSEIKLYGRINENTIFSEACSYQRGMLAQESKKENIKNMKEERELKKVISPATDKQIAYLKRLDYKGNYDLTKEEARQVIEAIKQNENNY